MPQPFDFAKGYVLTDEDVKVLRPLIEKHQRDRGNELLFRYGYEEPYWLDEGPPSQRSGTHIALVPVGGIAALTNPAGTGDDNIAGMAVCSIYQIAIDVTGTIATVVDTGLTERVYNLGQTPVNSRYVIVHLDRYGRWVAEANGDKPAYAQRNNSDQTMGSTTTIVFGKNVHNYGDDGTYAFSSNTLTVNKIGLHTHKLNLPVENPLTGGPVDFSFWLTDDTMASGPIDATKFTQTVAADSYEVVAVSFEHYTSVAGRQYNWIVDEGSATLVIKGASARFARWDVTRK